MARNEEKHFGRLNRIVLKELKEEEEKKNPKRPALESLHTAEAVKQWLPSIKRDLEFYLKQSEVSCYPERVIAEFSRRIDRLRGEYKAYLAKLKTLDSSLTTVPWTERAYTGKRRGAEQSVECSSEKKSRDTASYEKLSLPILAQNSISEGMCVAESAWNVVQGCGEELQGEDHLDVDGPYRALPWRHCKALHLTQQNVGGITETQHESVQYGVLNTETGAQHQGHAKEVRGSSQSDSQSTTLHQSAEPTHGALNDLPLQFFESSDRVTSQEHSSQVETKNSNALTAQTQVGDDDAVTSENRTSNLLGIDYASSSDESDN